MLETSVSQPLSASESQSSCCGSQAAIAQTPLLHEAVALGRLQACPQNPQCEAEVLRLVSQPGWLESQSPQPGGQEEEPQTPAVQVGDGPVQGLVHEPQWAGSATRLVSQPSASCPSQSPQPGSHELIEQTPSRHAVTACGRWQLQPQRFLTPPPPQVSGALHVPH